MLIFTMVRWSSWSWRKYLTCFYRIHMDLESSTNTKGKTSQSQDGCSVRIEADTELGAGGGAWESRGRRIERGDDQWWVTREPVRSARVPEERWAPEFPRLTLYPQMSGNWMGCHVVYRDPTGCGHSPIWSEFCLSRHHQIHIVIWAAQRKRRSTSRDYSLVVTAVPNFTP